MKLTLKIENYDSLPDGGPMEFTVNDRGFEVGRGQEMDWTLPDPNRRISSRHFEVTFRDRQFFLNDMSSNGTYVYGQTLRVSSPHLLTHNDRLQVGHYIVRVLISDPVAQAPAPQPGFGAGAPAAPQYGGDQYGGGAFGAPAAPAADPWSLTPHPAPMPTPMPAPNRPQVPLAGQFGDSFMDTTPQAPFPLTRPVEPAPGVMQTSPPVSMTPPEAASPPPMAMPPMAAPPPAPGPTPQSFAPPTFPAPSPPPAAPSGMGGAAAMQMPAAAPFAARPAPAAPAAPTPGPARTPVAGELSLLDAICKGAGLSAGTLSKVDPQQLGEEIGRCLRIATEEMMALLGARAAAKQFVKSASRTMIGGMNNSPLKFKPNAAEALSTMFAQRSDSYLSSTASFEQAFGDIKRHQTAVYAAMQPALARLLEDLSPESIEERATGGIMSSKKARAWETYVERWDAKTHPYENGMLDVFLAYFADAYDDAVKKTGG